MGGLAVRGKSIRKRLFIGAAVLVLLAAALISLYFLLDWQIPQDRKLTTLYYTDVFRGKHTVFGDDCDALLVTVKGMVSTDASAKRTVYAYSSERGDGVFLYPGTPKGQIYGYPRLREGERLFLIGNMNQTAVFVWIFRVRSVGGTDYAYPLLYDEEMIPLSTLGDSLPFEGDRERSVYDPWHDEDVFKYLKKYRKTAPAYPYKTTLENLTKNYRKLTRSPSFAIPWEDGRTFRPVTLDSSERS